MVDGLAGRLAYSTAFANQLNAKLIPGTERIVGENEWVFAWHIWFIVPESAGTFVGSNLLIPSKVGSKSGPVDCHEDRLRYPACIGPILKIEFEIAVLFVGRGIDPFAVVDEQAICDFPMLGKILIPGLLLLIRLGGKFAWI